MNEKDVNDYLTSLYADENHISRYGYFSLLFLMFSLALGIFKMFCHSLLNKNKNY